MAKRETVAEFAENFRKFDGVVEKHVEKQWNRQTIFTMGKAMDKAPVASGNLQRSAGRFKAQITPKGIRSAIEFKVAYAKKLNDPSGDFELKEPGELSYVLYAGKVGHKGKKKGVVRGTKVEKRAKGEKGFLDKAVDEDTDDFVKLVDEAISLGFKAI